MISVVILSWKRPDCVREICSRLECYGRVDEIIVWNNNPDQHLVLPGAKVTIIAASRDMGLFARFAAAALARNACILYHDDDVSASEEVLEELYGHWSRQPDVCHTLFGRNASRTAEYTTGLFFGPVEIALTRYTLVHRRVCLHALGRTPRFADLPGEPVGNGEDIILSHAAMELSGRPNRAYDLPTTELGQDPDVSIHLRYPGHIAHRTQIIRRCREVFAVRSVLLRHRLYRLGLRVGKKLRSWKGGKGTGP